MRMPGVRQTARGPGHGMPAPSDRTLGRAVLGGGWGGVGWAGVGGGFFLLFFLGGGGGMARAAIRSGHGIVPAFSCHRGAMEFARMGAVDKSHPVLGRVPGLSVTARRPSRGSRSRGAPGQAKEASRGPPRPHGHGRRSVRPEKLFGYTVKCPTQFLPARHHSHPQRMISVGGKTAST